MDIIACLRRNSTIYCTFIFQRNKKCGRNGLFAAFFSLSIFAHFFFSDFWTNFGRIKNLAQYPSKCPNMYLPRIFKISGTLIAIWIQNCGFRYWISGKSIYTFLKQPAQITLFRASVYCLSFVKRSKLTTEAEDTHIHEIEQLSSVSKKLGQLGRLRCSYNSHVGSCRKDLIKQKSFNFIITRGGGKEGRENN